VFPELDRLAHRYIREERPDHALQTGALADEAYAPVPLEKAESNQGPLSRKRELFLRLAARRDEREQRDAEMGVLFKRSLKNG
jgi:hypothetical protein